MTAALELEMSKEADSEPIGGLSWDLSTTGACAAAEHATQAIDGIVQATFSLFGSGDDSVLEADVTLAKNSDYVALIGCVTDDIIPHLEASAGVAASEKRIEFSVVSEKPTSIDSAADDAETDLDDTLTSSIAAAA